MSDETNNDKSPTLHFGIAAMNAMVSGVSFTQDAKVLGALTAVAATCFAIKALIKNNKNNHDNDHQPS